MEYLPIKPGDTVQIVLLNPDHVFTIPITEGVVDEIRFNSIIEKKNREGRVIGSCPHCEADKIESRFDILDIR